MFRDRDHDRDRDRDRDTISRLGQIFAAARPASPTVQSGRPTLHCMRSVCGELFPVVVTVLPVKVAAVTAAVTRKKIPRA
jgi:hypothetical protein